MKFALIAAAALAAASASAPAFAQDATARTGIYGTLGYSHHDINGADLNAVDGRIGDRLNNWFALEGEVGVGLGHGTVSLGLTETLTNQEAVYAVGLIPLGPNVDLFGRVGYGRTALKQSSGATMTRDENGVRWGAGA